MIGLPAAMTRKVMIMSEQVRLRPVTPDEHEAAVGILARGMRDNPVHVAAFGPDPDRRQWCLERMFRGLLRVVPERTMIGAYDGDTLVGFAVDATPGTCRLGPVRKARAAASMIAVGPASLLRVLDWQGTWERHHPTGAHPPSRPDRGRPRPAGQRDRIDDHEGARRPLGPDRRSGLPRDGQGAER
jgi:hypothetical protein